MHFINLSRIFFNVYVARDNIFQVLYIQWNRKVTPTFFPFITSERLIFKKKMTNLYVYIV